MSTVITEPEPQTTLEPPAEPTPEPAPAVANADKGRQYVVLRLAHFTESPTSDAEVWVPVGNYDASSTDEAIRKAAAWEATNPSDGSPIGILTYVAVPARSFQPVELTAKVEPKIEFIRGSGA